MPTIKAPSPEFVLRGHLGEVQAIDFHSYLEILYTGYVLTTFSVRHSQRR